MYFKTLDNGWVTFLTNVITNVEVISLWCAVFKEIYLKIYLCLFDLLRAYFIALVFFQTDSFAQTPC